MVTKLCLLLLAFSVFLSGCSRVRGVPKDRLPKADISNMIKIKEVTLTDETLTVVYEVVNPFEDDIRVCQNINVYGRQHVATRIDDEQVFIKLHINLEHEKAFWEPQPVAKYFRLRSGESQSSTTGRAGGMRKAPKRGHYVTLSSSCSWSFWRCS